MSVRRLAEDTVQPASFAFNKENAAWAKATIKKYPKGREQSAVIPLLMRAQEQDGWVTKAAIESVADMLGMPYIRVLEVATFYTQFQLKPVGTRAHVQVCGTTPCMLRGAEDLIKVCKSKIASDPFTLNESGTLSWEEVECQGACVNAPMVMIFKDTFEDLTPERLEQIIDDFEAGKGAAVTPGPQIDRVYSAPVGGPTTLLALDPATTNSPAQANPGRAKKTSNEPAVSIPPANAARAKTASAVTNPTLKTPATARKEAATIAKIEGETVDKSKPAKPAVVGRPSLEDKNRPASIEKPATVDDLKLISGVGPKIEGILHEIGIYTFAQVASWKKAEREWVDGYLNFKGRIERDDWVKQAKALAKGGEAEYIKVFGKKPR
ncbi:NADH-quinone oxidoreductase subunit E [Sinorhizobium terangae]|uniref:NADH-quinone oxidoreductase subunit E n=1 Tax=Sinorhizobium terangae TaxID=110322 RepID=A0A6N7L931_SINTE|nr:NADH-quinone oxidoreductase subunit E [Sinorhizobium terangae]MBB4185245.1 NADH-quinone oxidoreductase subunit E [Sinorhizobium terangae]MQX13455.1 NADH-quinone oxidoreductase subunit E [Sinorhizobium terangae]WFU48684.1 NADH-quinone oxidoreductase subunit E [Sinorhizobium terangae]